MSEQFASLWNSLIAGLPDPHVLQTWEWSLVKSRFGWSPIYALWLQDGTGRVNLVTLSGDENELPAPGQVVAAALVLVRSLPVRGFAARLGLMYVPKGPLLDWSQAELRRRVLEDLQAMARRQSVIFIKIDPDVHLGQGVPGQPEAEENTTGQAVIAELSADGWQFSEEQVQFRNTVWIDLRPDEDQLLAQMKSKTRYNIRLAGRKGVVVRPASETDLEALYRMYAETSIRDGFVIRDAAYYLFVWRTFMQNCREKPDAHRPCAEPLIAEVAGKPVAALVWFAFEHKAWYLYGMSRLEHREAMPNYLLQWEVIRRARAAGCTTYDLWGAPEVFDESDSMWGVYRFKEGLGGQVVRTLGAWDLPISPWKYRLYTQILPRFLDWLRQRGVRQTRQSVTG